MMVVATPRRPSVKPAAGLVSAGRLKRLGFTSLAVASLAFGLVGAVAWRVSLSKDQYFRWIGEFSFDEVVLARGRVMWREGWTANYVLRPGGRGFQRTSFPLVLNYPDAYDWTKEPGQFGGFWLDSTRSADVVVVPCWFVILAAALLPTYWLVAYRSRLARRRGNLYGFLPFRG